MKTPPGNARERLHLENWLQPALLTSILLPWQEISDTESEGQRFKRRANTSKPSAARDAAASKPAPAPSQRPAQPSEQPLDSSRQPFERQPHAIRSEPMAPARSPKPLQASEQPAYSGGGPSAVAEAAHLRPTPSPSPRPPGHKGPAKPGREDCATPHSTSMRGKHNEQLVG